MSIEFQSDFKVDVEIEKLKSQLIDIVDDEFLKAVADLQRNSAIGATGDLKRGWDISGTSLQSGELVCLVSNSADNALNRLEGRKSGRQPPSSALEKWVAFKLKLSGKELKSVAFLIARKIGKEGTERSKRNFKQFLVDGTPAKNSAVDRAITRIQRRLDKL